jgi:hypothetical protein
VNNITKSLKATLLIGLMALASSMVLGQGSGGPQSLGEIARQLNAEREKQRQKPVAVYTNDNLPRHESLGKVATDMEENSQTKVQARGKKGSEAVASEGHGAKYFRAKAEKISSQMEFHKRQLAVLQQQLGLASMQYYPDPQETLEQESTPAFQTNINKLRSKISNTEKAISSDQKAMEDLQGELRREGGDPGWIRQ